MITADASRLSSSADSVEIRITARSTEGSLEIGGIIVLDNQGHELFRDSIPDCGATYEGVIRVLQRRLPITLRVTECVRATPHDFPRLIPPDPGVRPCDPADTSPPPAACTAAQEEIRQLSVTMRELCATIANLEQQIVQQRQVVVFALALAAGFLVAAVIASAFGPVGWAIAIGLAAMAAFAAAIAIVAGIIVGVYLSQRSDANRRLREARAAFAQAVDDVRTHCCEHEIQVDLNPPC